MFQSFDINLKYIAQWDSCLQYERFCTIFFQLVQSHYRYLYFNVTFVKQIINLYLNEIDLFLILKLVNVNLVILTLIRFEWRSWLCILIHWNPSLARCFQNYWVMIFRYFLTWSCQELMKCFIYYFFHVMLIIWLRFSKILLQLI